MHSVVKAAWFHSSSSVQSFWRAHVQRTLVYQHVGAIQTLNLHPRGDLTSATLSTDFKKRSDYYIHEADMTSSWGWPRNFSVKLNFYCCPSKTTRLGGFYIFLCVISALTFRKQLSEFLGGWELLFWTIGENHLNHIRGDDCTLGFRWGKRMRVNESKRGKNLGLAKNRLHLLNQYQVYFLLNKNLGKTIMDNKGIITYEHLHKAASFSCVTLFYWKPKFKFSSRYGKKITLQNFPLVFSPFL